ncbi:MAG: DUF2975 domain-containing protein [Caulobacteraceae bacterium]
MRTLGPGSVSSFLKIVLEVVHVALWVALGLLLLGAMMVLVFQPFVGSIFVFNLHDLGRSHSARLSAPPAMIALVMFGVAIYLAILVVVFNRLRRIFETLTVGDPFRPQNVGRLQTVGAALTALQLWSYALSHLVHWTLPSLQQDKGVTINPTAWFSILVVFVLAEVFREGARLRQDAELTI